MGRCVNCQPLAHAWTSSGLAKVERARVADEQPAACCIAAAEGTLQAISSQAIHGRREVDGDAKRRCAMVAWPTAAETGARFGREQQLGPEPARRLLLSGLDLLETKLLN